MLVSLRLTADDKRMGLQKILELRAILDRGGVDAAQLGNHASPAMEIDGAKQFDSLLNVDI